MSPTSLPDLTCEVCGQEPAVGVAAVPGVPYSAAYGRTCLEVNAHPYNILVGNTAMIVWGYPAQDIEDPLASCAQWWRSMVYDTLTHLDITQAKFDADVREAVADFAKMEQDAGSITNDVNDAGDDNDF